MKDEWEKIQDHLDDAFEPVGDGVWTFVLAVITLGMVAFLLLVLGSLWN